MKRQIKQLMQQRKLAKLTQPGQQRGQKQNIRHILVAAVILAAVLSGCGDAGLEDELAYRQIGIESMETGDYEGAIVAFNAALSQRIGKITETELDICYYKAAAQYASGDHEAALATYDALLDYKEENANAHYLRGCLLLQMEEQERALKDFSDAVKYNEDEYELYINIYENLSAYNLITEGEEYLNKAFDIKGNNAENSAWRGKIYYLLGQYDNAKTELITAIDKGNVQANLTMAQVCEALGDAASAENYYQVYVASGSADSTAMNALAEIEIENGNYEAALEYIHQGLAMEYVPNQQELMQNEIIASEYAGDFANAWAVVQEYITLYPEDASAQREYTFLKNRQGVKEPATEEITEDTESTEQTP
ncbi:MAG: hypothetical protein J6C37_12975 [Roseburia sp.]|nr:hypothetical protein [Roseburia sp.]